MFPLRFPFCLLIGIAFSTVNSFEWRSPLKGDDPHDKSEKYWPNNIVPYEFDDNFKPHDKEKILAIFDEFSLKTCVTFVPHVEQDDFIFIQKVRRGGCSSRHGRQSGRNIVSFATPSCLKQNGKIIYVLMQMLGFHEESNRFDRDKYIKVVFDNVIPKAYKMFDKSLKQLPNTLPYDFGSVTHQRPYAFTVNGNATIVDKTNSTEAHLMGQRVGFSKGDLDKINYFYKCTKNRTRTNTIESTKSNSSNIKFDSETKNNINMPYIAENIQANVTECPNDTDTSVRFGLKTSKFLLKFNFDSKDEEHAKIKVIDFTKHNETLD